MLKRKVFSVVVYVIVSLLIASCFFLVSSFLYKAIITLYGNIIDATLDNFFRQHFISFVVIIVATQDLLLLEIAAAIQVIRTSKCTIPIVGKMALIILNKMS